VGQNIKWWGETSGEKTSTTGKTKGMHRTNHENQIRAKTSRHASCGKKEKRNPSTGNQRRQPWVPVLSFTEEFGSGKMEPKRSGKQINRKKKN